MKPMSFLKYFVLLAVLWCGLAVHAQTTYTWTNTAGGSWTNAVNWTNGAVATNSGNTASFGALTLSAAPTVMLDGARTIGNLIFGDTGNTYGWTLSTGSGGPLTLAVSSGSPTITVNGQTNTISLVLAGTSGMTKAGAGSLWLSDLNTYTGNTTVNAGNLTLSYNNGSSGTLSSGTLTVNNGASVTTPTVNALGYNGSTAWVTNLNLFGGTLTTTANGDQGWGLTVNLMGGTLASTGTGSHFSVGGGFAFNSIATNVASTISGTLNSRNAQPNNLIPFNVADGTASPDLVVSAVINNNQTGVGIVKTGAGTMSLTGANTFNGGTIVSNGVLQFSGSGGAAGTVQNSAITVMSGAELDCNTGDALGYGVTGLLTIGGTLKKINNQSETLFRPILLTNGTITSTITGEAYNFFGNYIQTAAGTTNLITGSGNFGLRSASCYFNVATNSTLTIAGVVQNYGGGATATPFQMTGGGRMVLTATNLYTGPTSTTNGLLEVDGSIGSGAVTIFSGATVDGRGTVNGPTTILSGGTLMVGTNVGTGTLSISNTLTLNAGSSTVLRLQKNGGTPICDLLQGMTSISYGGTLTVTNLTTDTTKLAAGDSFTLFNSSAYSGGFAFYNLPALTNGLAWDKSQLINNGSIRIISGTGTPTFNPPGGSYVGAQTVTITSDVGSTIFYTTDGSNPTNSATRISGASPITGILIPLNTNETLTACATNSGVSPSAVVSATYVTVPTATWTNTAGGSWPVTANWKYGVVGNGSRVTADFSTLTLPGNITVAVSSPETIGKILFADQGNTYGWTLSGSSPLTVDAGVTVPSIVVSNQSVTISATIAGTNGLNVSGAGSMTLSSANNNFTNLTLSGVSVTAPAQVATASATCALGAKVASSTITVNSNATLSFTINNVFGGGGMSAATLPTMVVNGLLFASRYNAIPNLVLNGGTLNQSASDSGSYQGYQFLGTVTVGGTAASTISTGNGNADHLLGSGTTFNVVLTGASGPDLIVSGPLTDASGDYGSSPGVLIKIGSGVMALDTNNTYTGTTTISAGTLQLGTTNDTSVLTATLGTGLVTNNANLKFGSSVGVTVSNVISGSGTLTVSSGTNILAAADTCTGNTTINGGTLQFVGSGSVAATPHIYVNRGGTFDVSQLASPFTVGTNQVLGGNGLILGNVMVNGMLLTGVTNTINGNLTYNPGAAANFNLNTNAIGGGNDQTILSGAGNVLTCGGVNVGILLTGASLDQTNDYVLFKLAGGGSVSGSFNPVPVWLGTVPANAGSYSVVSVANEVVLHNNSLGATNVPAVTNLPASNIFPTAATLNGKLLSSGGQFPAVILYYGTSDGGTNPAAWTASVSLGLRSGSFAATVSNLTANTTYYFATFATNSVGAAWATPSLSFLTPSFIPASVTNLPASNVQANSAVLNGQVVSAGNQTPMVSIYYGPTNGGTNPAAWANQIFLGAQTGVFSSQVAALNANTTYYFTTSVSNSAGVSWGGPSQTFTTLTITRISVLTYHYDNTRQGQNTNETLLTPSNVNVTNFGKLFTYTVDGYVYAQPLIMTNVNMAGKGVRNVMFVSTMHDSVYAFDADSNSDTNGGLLWKTNLGISSQSPSLEYGARYHPGVGNLDVVPEEGAASAPVIDPVSGTIYLDAFTREVVAGVSTNYFHRIHALNITNGFERPYSPVPVVASVPGTGVSGNNYGETVNGSNVTFSAVQHMQRPALTLAGGILYAAYGSHDDTDPYHGWVIGFNATNLVLLTNYVFNTTPNATIAAFGANAGEGSLWMGGNGLSVDANTNIYFETGNGSFSANTNGGDYADSFLKLSTTNNKLAVADYFTPYNQLSLQNSDADLGSGGPLLLPDSVGSVAHPHLIVGAGKQGKIYLLDRDNMGHYNGTDGINGTDSQIVESLPGAIGGVWNSPAYFNNRIYYHGNGDVLKAFLITNGFIVATPDSQSATSFGFPGATPTISGNGTNNGIAWDIQADAYLSSGPAVLHAYNATNVAIELYNSSMNLARDNPGGAVKMTPPVIAGGKVYVGAEYAVSVFGLAVFLPTPTISPAGGNFTNSVLISLADPTAGVSIYYTLDGTAPTSGSTLYSGPFNLTSNALVQAIAIAPGAANSAIASASFVNSAAAGNGTGLLGQYFANQSSTNPFTGAAVLVRTNATINFNWGTTGPSPLVGATNFTVLWTGCVQPQYNETYNFITTADDGVRLYINGQLLINDWVDKTNATSHTNSISLVGQQLYNLELDYYQKTNNASVSLSWSSPSTPLAIVPQTQLYPFTNPPPAVVLVVPSNSATNYTAAASVTLGAQADGLYNPIGSVAFYANGSLLGTLSNSLDAPLYELTVTGLGAGNYSLTAVATDGSGLSSTSAPVNITVVAGSGLAYGLTSNATVTPFLNMPTTYNGALPAVLSGTGAFSNTTNRTPAAGLIPYAPNAPQWKDNALSSWLMAVPNNGGLISPDEQIQFKPTNYWTFPAGSVFVKNFDLIVNETNATVRRLETELLVRNNNGSVYGVNYKWRLDNCDADLLTGSLSEDILITNATGVRTQTWYYASPSDCQECHNTAIAGNASGVNVLGVNARQLNGSLTYPTTGVTDNQLRTLNRLGLFNPAFNETAIGSYSQLSAMTNLSASLQERVRSYLDANCEHCHQPGGQGITWDARYDTPLAQQDITNYPAAFSLGISDGACVVRAKDIWRSVLVSRVNTLNQDIQMPDFRNLIDTNGVQVITDWINSLPGTPALAPPGIAPNGGSYVASVSVTLTAPDTNATVYYTLDGSVPTTNSLRYTGAFYLLNNTAVSANAFETNYNNSVAASALFLVEPLSFISQGFLTNHQFQMGFSGVTGSNYVLLASTNFSTWTPISTNTAATNVFNLLDPKATNFPYRFYRVLRQ
jgi:autotransporter-associated beta strand protein